MRWVDARGPGLSRKGGAGPSDHKAVRVGQDTVMVPILNGASRSSPYVARVEGDRAVLLRDGRVLGALTFPKTPRFYERSTASGIPYWKIATLHADDVLATTVLQTCIRYGRRDRSCQFCGIGLSLAARATIPEKTPAMLAEVAKAAVELDGVRHMVLTTGTPPGSDRGARVLADAASAIRAVTSLPIQAQCEPPADFSWFLRLRAAGVDSLGLHLEAVTEAVRQRVMPAKAEVPLSVYFQAFASAVLVFGRGQVSTYILFGLGDTREAILEACERLVAIGVYPFVVPFVPIAGTPLEAHPPPEPRELALVLDGVARIIARGGLSAANIKAGCGRCGACSTLKLREARRA